MSYQVVGAIGGVFIGCFGMKILLWFINRDKNIIRDNSVAGLINKYADGVLVIGAAVGGLVVGGTLGLSFGGYQLAMGNHPINWLWHIVAGFFMWANP